jgi:hypothetical protein
MKKFLAYYVNTAMYQFRIDGYNAAHQSPAFTRFICARTP